MKKRIVILTDYKNNFGSKWNNVTYRSGMDKEILKKNFEKSGYSVKFMNISNVKFDDEFSKEDTILYTSSEDIGYHYKNYIEDVIFGLKEKGLRVLPDFKFLRANNNKVFMEILKSIIFTDSVNNLSAAHYGVLEDIDIDGLTYPVVIKESIGAMSRGVALAINKQDFLKKAKKISRTQNIKKDLKDFLRSKKHKGYVRESLYRKKFIIQQFIPELTSDFKILIFGERYYIFERPVRKNDFRASGSGNANYIYGSNVNCPNGIFNFAKNVFDQAELPNISIDIAFDGNKFYLLEFQAIYFGTVGHAKADGYYMLNNGNWEFVKKKIDIEEVYADSIVNFLKN